MSGSRVFHNDDRTWIISSELGFLFCPWNVKCGLLILFVFVCDSYPDDH